MQAENETKKMLTRKSFNFKYTDIHWHAHHLSSVIRIFTTYFLILRQIKSFYYIVILPSKTKPHCMNFRWDSTSVLHPQKDDWKTWRKSLYPKRNYIAKSLHVNFLFNCPHSYSHYSIWKSRHKSHQKPKVNTDDNKLH